MKSRHFTKLHTDFDPDECFRRLLESIDPERRTIFSFSGYKGSKPVIGRLNGYQFWLHKRTYWRNDFAPQARGSLVARERGTIIECYFDMPPWSKWFMRIWLALVILITTPIFITSFNTLIKSGDYIGLIVPPAMILFGIILPKFGLWAGKSEESFILEFLKRTLIANKSEPNQNN